MLSQLFGGISDSHLLSVYLFILLFSIGLIELLRIDFNKFLFLGIAIIIPLTVGWWISYKMPTDPRYFISLITYFQIGISFFFLPMKKWFSVTRFFSIAVLIIAIISIPSINSYYSLNTKWDDWEGISHEIQNLTDDGDIIIIVPSWYTHVFRYYYDNTVDNTSIYRAQKPDEIERIVLEHQGETIFFVCTNHIAESYEWIDSNATLVSQFGYHYIYQLNSMPEIHSSITSTGTI
jgi:hypothetical protein